MRKLTYILLFLLIVVVFAVGCGSQSTGDTASSTEVAEDNKDDEKKDDVKVIDEIPKDERLNTFNDALGNVTDEASARTAVELFVDYVDSRLIEDAVSARGAAREILSSDLIDRIAKKQVEAAKAEARGEKVSLIGKAPQEIAQNINSLVTADQVGVSEELVSDVQSEVRKELPNLASDDNENMQPIEAMVVGYVIYSGDDGGAGPASVDLGASNDQIQQYVENIL